MTRTHLPYPTHQTHQPYLPYLPHQPYLPHLPYPTHLSGSRVLFGAVAEAWVVQLCPICVS